MLFYCAPLRRPSTTGLCNTLSQHSSTRLSYPLLLSAFFSIPLQHSTLVFKYEKACQFPVILANANLCHSSKVWYTSGKCIRPGKCLTLAYEVSFTLKLILTLHLSMAKEEWVMFEIFEHCSLPKTSIWSPISFTLFWSPSTCFSLCSERAYKMQKHSWEPLVHNYICWSVNAWK